MMVVRLLLAYCFCVALPMAAAQPSALQAPGQKYEGMVIRNIQFVPQEQPLEASELHDLLPLKMNQPLRMSDVRASIEKLFATGTYADIQVDAQLYRDGVAISFVTKNSWFVGAVSASGRISSPPNSGQLENAADLNLGQPYRDATLQQGLADQQRALENNGLYRGAIHPVLDWETGRDHQQVNIRFEIDSGPRARFTTPVLTGDLKMDAQKISTATKFQRWLIHTWKPMTQTRVRQALDGVRLLYQRENRLEAKVALDSMRYDPAANRAIPTLRIDAGPRIEVRTIGVNLSQKKLRRYIPVFEEHAVDHDLLVEGARNLRDYFQSAGYFDAEIEFKEQRVINDKAAIDFLVNTGTRHKLVAIEIGGNQYFKTEAIRERMFLQPASFLQFPHGRYSGNLLARDEESIRNLYQSNGFRDVQVTHRLEDDYRGKVGDIAVFIVIQEGPQYLIASLQVEGIERMNQAEILSRLSSVVGQPFSEFSVAVDRDTILAQYFESGFPNATFEWNSSPAAEAHRVALRFVIHEGEQQFVRQVLVTGNKVTKEQLIDRNLKLNPGDPLSPAAITETQRRLYDLGVFAKVDAAIQNPDGETNRKYVLYNLDEARRYSLATGFGAELGRIGGCQTCFEAPAGTTGFSPRVSIDLTRNNLWGDTHSISLRTRVSTLDQRALLNYSWPRFRNQDNLTVSFTGLYEASRDVRTFNFKREEGSAQLTQKLTKATTLFYRMAYRRVSVSDLKITPFLVPQLSQPVRVGITSINLVQDRRDDPVEPHKGVYTTVDLGLAGKFLGSQVNFMRFLVRNASYYPIGKKLVLARSTQFGDIRAFNFSGDPLEAIPLPERFFGGGGTSHRGFPEYQAGPRDTSTGFPLGGTALFFNQTEIRFPLIGDNIGGVLYHDMGNVYSTLSNLSFRVHQHDLQDFDYMVHAAGFGIRYRTPVGPLRVDLGYSINPPYFFGFKGTQQDLINAGVNPCSPGSPVVSQCVAQNVSHFQFFFSIGQTF
ncbi:MAG: outer membrane protein assembly factor BamA [Acidobacteriia bacterium]|nr:outer membrane protein assembly factor BamA [Terriglobia bacterium]